MTSSGPNWCVGNGQAQLANNPPASRSVSSQPASNQPAREAVPGNVPGPPTPPSRPHMPIRLWDRSIEPRRRPTLRFAFGTPTSLSLGNRPGWLPSRVADVSGGRQLRGQRACMRQDASHPGKTAGPISASPDPVVQVTNNNTALQALEKPGQQLLVQQLGNATKPARNPYSVHIPYTHTHLEITIQTRNRNTRHRRGLPYACRPLFRPRRHPTPASSAAKTWGARQGLDRCGVSAHPFCQEFECFQKSLAWGQSLLNINQ